MKNFKRLVSEDGKNWFYIYGWGLTNRKAKISLKNKLKYFKWIAKNTQD